MLERWEELVSVLEGGWLTPDTNTSTAERSIWPISIGKKEPVSGDEGAEEAWAILASLFSTAKLNGVGPKACLADVLERMVGGVTKNHQLRELLVWN